MNDQTFQVELFTYIQSKIPPTSSLVKEVADVLSISTDSAYRRIRGDKFMVLPELIQLCSRFNIPLNEMVEISDSKTVSFSTQFIESDSNSIKNFLMALRNEMENISQPENSKVIFVLKDLNIFQLLQSPELAAFKFYFWRKSGLGSKEYSIEPFSITKFKEENESIISEIISYYLKVDSIELFSSDVLESAKKQIIYYYELGYFQEKSDLITLLQKLQEMADHLSLQAESKRKFALGYTNDIRNGAYSLYFNNLITVDNLILAEFGNEKVSFLTNNLINLMKSTNKTFYEYNKRIVSNMIKRSELISGTGERTRKMVFSEIKKQITNSIERFS